VKNWNLIFRRTHLYLGLLLIPWMLVYALSTLAFNHHDFFGPRKPPDQQWHPVWEKDYAVELPSGDPGLRDLARRILDENGLKGTFAVNRQGQRLNIALPSFLHPTRLIYDSSAKKLRAEAREHSTADLLGRLHTRTGYGRGTWLNDLWALMVDTFCVTTLVWIATGLYLWWKLPMVRGAGCVAIAGGVVTIAVLFWTV
jgi:hypothetical protein